MNIPTRTKPPAPHTPHLTDARIVTETRDAVVMENLKKATVVFTIVFAVFAVFNTQGTPFKDHKPLVIVETVLSAYGALWSVLAHLKLIPDRQANLSATLLTWFIMSTIVFATIQLPRYAPEQQIFFLLMSVWAGAVILSHRWLLAAIIPPILAALIVYQTQLDSIRFIQSALAVFCFFSCSWILHSIRHAYLIRSEHLRLLALELVRVRDEKEVVATVAQHAALVLNSTAWAVQEVTETGAHAWRYGGRHRAGWKSDRRGLVELFKEKTEKSTDPAPLEPTPLGAWPSLWRSWSLRARRIIGIPVVGAGNLRAVVWLGRTGGRGYNLIEQRFASACATYARHAMENIDLNKEIERLATVDPLTGIFNRRQFLFLGEREFRKRGRAFRPLAIVMADIDHFKNINDRWGHPAGDAVLVEMARRLKKGVRDMDILGRYGGEEFVLALLATDGPETLNIVERLRREVGTVPFQVPGGTLNVTISLGVALRARESEETIEQTIARADKGLYKAKKLGRNRVVFVEERTD